MYVWQRDPWPSKPSHWARASADPAVEDDQPTVSEPNSPQPAASVAATAQTTPPALTEAALMEQLRALGDTEPKRSLELAKQGDERFPNSPDSAERGWRIAKSLDNLKRHREARDYAKVMVEKYRGTSWALDVERHLLVHPLDYPSREELQRRADAGTDRDLR
jgi:hypothetical protein